MLVPRIRWRKRRYYAEEGLLKPIPGSRNEEYDPFVATPPPYLELAALDTADQRAIEGFATSFGLLGLLQQALHEDLGAFGDAAEARGVAEVAEDLREAVPSYAARYLPALTGEPLARISAVMHGDELWDYLAEPVEEFRLAAEEFREFYALAARTAEGTLTTDDAERLNRRLAAHLRQVRPETRFSTTEDGTGVAGWTLVWPFSSLLAACYHQLLLDLTGGRYLRRCKNERCRKPFLATGKSRFYCCDACGNAQEQRERRRRRSAEQDQECRPAAS